MMYIRDSDDPHAIIANLLESVPSGSYLVMTHPTADFDARAVASVVASAESAGITFNPRGQTETDFAGTEIVEPGVVPVVTWHPELIGDLSGRMQAIQADPESAWYWAGVGRKPDIDPFGSAPVGNSSYEVINHGQRSGEAVDGG